MDLGMEAGIFLAYSAGLLIVYFFGRALLLPLKKALKLVVNSLVGAVALILINVVGAGIGIVMPVNVITAGIVGILGLPGTAALFIYFNGIT